MQQRYPTLGLLLSFFFVSFARAQAPVADFTGAPLTTCDGLVAFQNASEGAGNTYAWNFGDGSGTSTEVSPEYQYTTPGVYTVTLVATNAAGADTLVRTDYVTFDEGLTPSCTPNTINNCCNFGIIRFQLGQIDNTSADGSAGYEDFSCSATANLLTGSSQTFTVQMGPGGPQLVAGWIDYNNDGALTLSERFFIDFNTTLGNPTNEVVTGTFTVPTGAVTGTPLLLRLWSDFVGGTAEPCASPQIGQVEDYAVTIITDGDLPPIANFVGAPLLLQPGESVAFVDLSDPDPTSWLWSFPGGTPATSTVSSVNVTYDTPGTYDVQLIVGNANSSDTLLRPNYVTVSDFFTLCDDTEGNAPTGRLYDSGGPNGNYGNNEDCSFLIDPGCGDSITLSFQSFQVQAFGSDALRIYDGPDATAPLLFDGDGNFVPPPVIATSGQMFIEFSSDFNGNAPGFEATWEATLLATEPPVAAFDVSTLTPPLNAPVTFTDQTTNAPFAWAWTFGDGGTSEDQNPTYFYDTPGTYTVQLIATNCVTSDTTTTSVTVQAAPAATISPASFDITLATCDDSTTVPLTINNAGSGALFYELLPEVIPLRIAYYQQNVGAASSANIEAIINGSSLETVITDVATNSPAALAEALTDQDVFLIPAYQGSSFVFGNFAPVLEAFVASGGTVIFTSSNFNNYVFETELFSGFWQNFVPLNSTLDVLDQTDPITSGLPQTITSPGNTLAAFLFGGQAETLVSFTAFGNSNAVVARRGIGDGQAILLGFDYLGSTPQTNQILINALNEAGGGSALPSWLSVDPTGTVGANTVGTVDLTFRAGGLAVGTYDLSFVLTTNDPNNAEVTVPVTLTINGDPAYSFPSLTEGCVAFNPAVVDGTRTDSVLVENTGCDTLDVTSLMAPGPYFSVQGTNFSLAPGASTWVTLTFSPDSVGNFVGELVLGGNAGDSTICLTGEGVDFLPENFMCQQSESNGSVGTIYDSGGPNGNYGDNEQCTFLIAPPCAATITLTLTELNVEEFFDQLVIFDGPDQTAPILANLDGTALPGPIVASSGQMFLAFSSDGFENFAGFTAEWTSTLVNAGDPPTADFSVSDATPPLNGPVTFTDETVGEPFAWQWTFGDGGTSSSQSPTYAYNTPGTYTVTLVAENCGGTDTTTQQLTVQGAPTASVSPASFDLTLACTEGTEVSFTLSNTGSGPLLFETLQPDSVSVLMYRTSQVAQPSYDAIVELLGEANLNLGITDYTGGTPLSNALLGKSVLIVPSIVGNADAAFEGAAAALNEFVASGGTVLFCTDEETSNHIFTSTLFSGNSSTVTNFPFGVTTAVPGDPLAVGLPASFSAIPPNVYFNITDSDAVDVVTATPFFSLLVRRPIGAGNAVALGTGFRYTDPAPELEQILLNVLTSAVQASWYTTSPPVGTVAAGESLTVTVNIDASSFAVGTYDLTLPLATNDPANPTLEIPVLLNITGDTAATIGGLGNDGCLDLGTIFTDQTGVASLLIDNIGCASYAVSIGALTGGFATSATDLTLGPGQNASIEVSLTVTEPGNYAGTLTLGLPGGDTTICLTATVLPAPATYNLCEDVEANEAGGLLYDSGGPNGSYSNNEDCSFLIDVGCAAGITLTFEEFDLENNFDRLLIYDGPTTASPLLANLTGTALPAPITSTSGQMLVRMDTDGSVIRPGFVANWTSDPVEEPSLGIIVEGNPVAGEALIFSASGPQIATYAWAFGNGETSTQSNPSVTYTDEGSFEVTLEVTTTLGCTQRDTLTVLVTNLAGGLTRSAWQVYPNPSGGRAQVALPEGVGPFTLSVIDGLSREVWRQEYRQAPPEPPTLNLLVGGVYYVRLTTERGTSVQKLVVR